MPLYLVLLYIGSLLNAICISLGFISWRRLSLPFRLVICEMVFNLIWEHFVRYMGIIYGTNVVFQNFYPLIEGGFLMIIAMRLSKAVSFRRFIIIGSIVCLAHWVITIAINGINIRVDLVFLSVFLLICAVYFSLIFRRIFEQPMYITKDPVFWLCLSVIAFYGGSFPVFSYFNYLVYKHGNVASEVYSIIIFFLNYLRYILLMITFSFFLKAGKWAKS
jgi:hypothetical protein